VIRERRQQLDMRQEDLARLIKTSTPYIGHLEAAKRHPSEAVVRKLAHVLGLDPRELYLLANPGTEILISQQPPAKGASAWESFTNDRNLRKIYDITEQEMHVLSRIAMMGEVHSPRDFLFILNSIRQAFSQ
jgi:transcriptional regulator with XRE-family HTH domain